MILREVSGAIHKYGNQEYKKGYDAGRSDQKKLLKAEVLKQIQAAYDRGFKDGEQEAIKAMKERAKTW